MARLLLKCHDHVGKTMAGPAIRYWELAKVLSKQHQVTLQIPNEMAEHNEKFEIVSVKSKIDLSQFEILITQLIDPKTALMAKYHGVHLIYDAYDPEPLEHLEIFKASSLGTRCFLNNKIVNTVNFSLEMADGYLCANEKQKDLWTGALLSLKKISPHLYDKDVSLDCFMGIVPFGMTSKPPQKVREGFREKFNLKSSDKLLIWGGGIWNWFDPLTLLTAMKILSKKRNDIKLVFMGLIHPNAAAIPAMSMAIEAKNLANTFGLEGHSVFFNDTWIPYDERENYLLDADIGVSTHFEHLETRFSFRTRLLDYIWAGLPIVATQGDVFGEFIEKHQIGIAVPPNNSQKIADAIEKIVDDPVLLQKMKDNIVQVQSQFYWENVVKPIENMIDYFVDQGRSKISLAEMIKISGCVWRKFGPYALFQRLKLHLSHAFKI